MTELKEKVVFVDKNEFEIEFHSDEEVWEMLNHVVVTVGEDAPADESKATVPNPIKMQQMRFAYGVLKYLTRGTGAKLTYMLNEPFKSMGSICVAGKNLTFANAVWFARAAEFASSVEVSPLTNGNVKMTLTFHGLVRPAE